MTDALTRKDRDELVRVVRMRGKLAHADIAEREARLKAQIENELSAVFATDDSRWDDLTREAKAEISRLDGELAKRCIALGLKPECRPALVLSWLERGANADRQRRFELRTLAAARIQSLTRAAKLDIDRQVADSITALISGGLSSDEARAELECLPSADSLMLAPSVAELEAVYDRQRSSRELGR
ncbi:MAG TPA: hypothetical protein VNJ54_08375 [Plantibacter sp.]|uniref:hypothetical protein n=1 Tax=Plantibacter sp. TaxID=1871045 RepID=UPI002C68E82D|nr:hypothetical protein [Plantibacter sp.]